MTTITAKTILRSRNAADPSGNVLSCLLLRYPRCIHAEVMTHKMLMKNSASSRAIPVKKLIQSIKDDPFVPLHWGKNQKGMQAYEECDAKVRIWKRTEHMGSIPENMSNEKAWLHGMKQMLEIAEAFDKAGYHKQIVNRLIEPWMHITVLVSGMDKIGWSNFIGLRDHEAAEPHIQVLAKEVRKCLEEDPIQTLQPGEWHLPFVTAEDWAEADAFTRHGSDVYPNSDDPRSAEQIAFENLRKLSTARCASVSYKTIEGFDMDLANATRIHDQLVGSTPAHMSPAEHIAQADDASPGRDGMMSWNRPSQHRAFSGFRQYRAMLPGECL